MRGVLAISPSHTKGLGVVRAAIASAAGAKGIGSPIDIAERWGGANGAPARLLKAAVRSGRYSDYGSDEKAVAEFFDAVREASVLRRMTALRRVPMRVRTMTPTTPITAHWVQPGDAVPAGRTVFAADALAPLHVAALTVATKESLEAAIGGDPLAEQAIRRDMVTAVAHAVDEALLDPSNAGVADEQPASITNGVSAQTAGGDPVADLKGLIGSFTGDLASSVLIMRPDIAVSLYGSDFPDISALGGSAIGLPVATTRKAPANTIILADAAGIAEAEGDVGIRTSTQASIVMDDDPSMSGDSPVVEQTVVSLWQTDSAGFIADLAINWKVVRSGSVAVLDGIAWSPFLT